MQKIINLNSTTVCSDEDITATCIRASEKRKKRILITGANGFLGSRLAWYLREKSEFDVYSPSHTEMDITDIKACHAYISQYKPHYVIHCAAISSTAFCNEHPEVSRDVNINGTCNIVKVSADQNSRCIYMSSDQVYQTATNEWTHTYTEDETDLYHNPPKSIYGHDKLEMELKAQEIDPTAIGLRLTWMYSSDILNSMPESPEKFRVNHGIMSNLVKSKLERVPIKACTKERRGVTDVWYIVRGIAKILERNIPGGIYNLGNECSFSTFELYTILAKQLKIDTSLIIPDNSWSRSLAMDTSKINEFLDY